MCYHHEEEWRIEGHNHRTPPPTTAVAAATPAARLLNLTRRLAVTEARLAEARVREAALSRQLSDMKRFVSVMEILESYLKQRFRQQNDLLRHLLASERGKSRFKFSINDGVTRACDHMFGSIKHEPVRRNVWHNRSDRHYPQKMAVFSSSLLNPRQQIGPQDTRLIHYNKSRKNR